MSDYFNLEQLPNEIFEEIFEYFDTHEIYETFFRLNSRIDSLITNFKYLQVILYSPEDIYHPVNRDFLTKTKTLINYHTKNFYDPMKCSLLSIRCLILCQPTREQWNSIQPSVFPYLERLYLKNSTFVYRTEELCRLIFTDRFLYLRKCLIPHISYEDNNSWTYSLSLQSLQINIWDIRLYTRILDTCPKLIRLKMELTGGNIHEKLSLCTSDKKHSILRYLSLYTHSSITCEFIDSILSFVPNLEYFALTNNYFQPSHISIDTLAYIFVHRTPKLIHLDIDITLPKNLCYKGLTHMKNLLFKSYQIQSGINQLTRLIIVGSL